MTYSHTTVTSEVGSNDQCCGDCNIRYSDVIIYYWPTEDTSKSCLEDQPTVLGAESIQDNQTVDPGLPGPLRSNSLPSATSTNQVTLNTEAGSDREGILTEEPSALKRRHKGHPMITAAPKRSIERPAHHVGPRVYVPPSGLKDISKANPKHPLRFDGRPSNFTSSSSNVAHSNRLYKEVIDVVNGFTFRSPTVYVVVSTISAYNKCGRVGGVHTFRTVPYDEPQLSTVDSIGDTSSSDIAGFSCSPSSWAFLNPLQGNTAALQHLDQNWQSCNIISVGNEYETSILLNPHTVIVATTPSITTVCADGGLGDPELFYTENTMSRCLEPLTAAPQLIFGGKEPANAEIEGPNYLTPAMVPLVQITPHILQAPKPQYQTLAPAMTSQKPPNADNQPLSSSRPVPPPFVLSPFVLSPPVQTPVVDAQPFQLAQSVQGEKADATPLPPPSVIVAGQTIAQGAPPVIIGSQPVALSGGNIIVGSSTAPAPVPQPMPSKSKAPIVAGGVTLIPAFKTPPTFPSLPAVEVAGLKFSAPQAEVQPPSNPQPLPLPVPVIAGGITYQPLAPLSSEMPVTVGGLTFHPVPRPDVGNTKQDKPPEIGASGETGSPNIVVGGQTYVSGVTAMPADKPIVENGVTIAPVAAGAPASTPLGVVGDQAIIMGSSSQAVVAGQTLSVGGSHIAVHGTPVSLGRSEIIIGSNTAALPPSSLANEASILGVVGGQIINGNSQSAVIAGHTISAGGSPLTIEGTPVSLRSTDIVIGSSTVALPSSDAESGESTNPPLGIVAGKAITGDKYHAVVDGQTILPGSLATISGTPVSLGTANIVIGKNFIPLPTHIPEAISSTGPSALEIGGKTVSNGGPPITVSGTRISLGSSGLEVGSSTVPLTNPAQLSQATGGPPIYSIDGSPVTQGSPAITVSGTRISVGSSNVIIGSKTINIPSSSVFSVGGQAFTPVAGGFSIDGTTLTPGQGITVFGTPISIDSDSDLIFGSSTFALPAGASGYPTLAVAGDTLTALPMSLGGGFVIDGQTINPGAAPETISHTLVSLNKQSSLIIGSSTIALASTGPGDSYQGSDTTLTADGETFTPLGASAVVIDGKTLSVSGAAITDHGAIVSLASGGLVVNSSTFAYATPASNTLTPVSNGPLSGQGPNPTVFTIDGETFTAEASGMSIDSTDVSIGGLPITLNGTVISLASDSIVVGASTIPFANVSGLTSAIDSASAAAMQTAASASTLLGPTGAGPSKTGKEEKTGAAGRLEVADLRDWEILAVLGILNLLIAWLVSI